MILGRHELLQAQKTDEAIALFLANSTLFPASTNAWDSLGEAYAEKGETDQAIEAHEHILELDADNENARSRIDELIRQ